MSAVAGITNIGFNAICIGPSQKITTGAAAVSSTPVATTTTVVRVVCTQSCYIAIGPSGTTSTATSCFIPSNTVQYFGCNGSDVVSVIQDSTTGTFYLTEGR